MCWKGRVLMIQQFIELGQGYGDIYELCELIKTNEHRFHHAFIFVSSKNDHQCCSLAVAFKPVGESKFMPIYVCREGIPFNEEKKAKRIEIFENTLQTLQKTPNQLTIKHSSEFANEKMYYQHLIGILRMNHYIPSMS